MNNVLARSDALPELHVSLKYNNAVHKQITVEINAVILMNISL
jgi:hypothetical protein